MATGLAWTPVGGDVLFVEAMAYPGEGKLQITGQLGDVMKESAAAALSYVRNLDGELVPPEWFREHDIHVHVPAGAIPKDGPSAGITMATAIASRATGRPVRSDTAMTGEITLTGLVLPIGGLKEKALAAQRAGINRLIIPRRNERDIDDIPEPLRKKMKFMLVDTVDEVLDAALQKRAAAFVALQTRVKCPPSQADRGEQWQQRKRPQRPEPERTPPARRSATTSTYSGSSRTTSCATTSAPRSSPPGRHTGGCQRQGPGQGPQRTRRRRRSCARRRPR